MKTLSDAWNWYVSAKKNLERMRRLGWKHWKHSSLKDASIWLDEQFKEVEAEDIVSGTTKALKEIEDLAVLVLFAVFEGVVRDHLEVIIQPEADTLTHPILQNAAKDAIEGVQDGSFSLRILIPLQKQNLIESELIDKVKQVRDYRNWVAHGKREPRKKKKIANLDPQEAYSRLKEFLERLGIVVEPEHEELEASGEGDE